MLICRHDLYPCRALRSQASDNVWVIVGGGESRCPVSNWCMPSLSAESVIGVVEREAQSGASPEHDRGARRHKTEVETISSATRSRDHVCCANIRIEILGINCWGRTTSSTDMAPDPPAVHRPWCTAIPERHEQFLQ
ncbi:unnamed protein product [Mycena citricolor]|uniref:Uncharacterized protein n=1 Tax=Mycena citricolor TaxID=2018698 RepID=A0AAD2GXS0_9AGAR|nr:unnamed protein product [Mycena citricolor]